MGNADIARIGQKTDRNAFFMTSMVNSQDSFVPLTVSVLLTGGGLFLGGYMMVLEPTLWLIPLRRILIAVSAILIVIGGFIGRTRSFRPLTTLRAGGIPPTVAIALGVLLWYDLQRLGVDNLWVVLKPQQGILIAASLGFPVGAALKQHRVQSILVAAGSSIVLLGGTILTFRKISTRVPRGVFVYFVVLGGLAVVGGFLLTRPEDGES